MELTEPAAEGGVEDEAPPTFADKGGTDETHGLLQREAEDIGGSYVPSRRWIRKGTSSPFMAHLSIIFFLTSFPWLLYPAPSSATPVGGCRVAALSARPPPHLPPPPALPNTAARLPRCRSPARPPSDPAQPVVLPHRLASATGRTTTAVSPLAPPTSPL
jgi:hypothetical protein